MTAAEPSSPPGALGEGQKPGLLRRHRNLLTVLLLALAAWLLYLPTIRYGFVDYDDVKILKDHPELYGQPHLGADLKAIFVTAFPREEPLLIRDVTWALDSRLFGFGNAFGYHLDNVLLHGIVVALLFVFLFGTTRRYGFALTTAVAYLALAVHTEPVAWIMGRKDILSALFMLLALCAQTRRLTVGNAAARWGWYAATLIFFALGLLSKISVLAFPAVLFLHAVLHPYLRGERQPGAPFSWGRALAREVLLLAPSLAITGATYVWYHRILQEMGVFNRDYTAHGLTPLWNLLMIDPMVFWVYLRQIFFPWHLATLYTWPGLRAPYPPWQIAASLATVAAAGGIGVWLFRRRKDLFFYYAAFFALMVPYSNLIYIGIWVAERYIYFSSFCVVAIAVSLAGAALRSPKPAWHIGALMISIVFVAMNLFQKLAYEPAWRNGVTLWQYQIELPHPSPVAYNNLGSCYYANFAAAFARHDARQEVSSLRKLEVVIQAGFAKFWSDRRQPPPPDTYFFFFLQSLEQEVKGDLQGALTNLLTSDRLRPQNPATYLNLAQLYRKLAKVAKTPEQQQADLRAARDRFREYIALAFHGRPGPPAVRKELADIEAECAKVGLPPSHSESKPPEKKSGP